MQQKKRNEQWSPLFLSSRIRFILPHGYTLNKIISPVLKNLGLFNIELNHNNQTFLAMCYSQNKKNPIIWKAPIGRCPKSSNVFYKMISRYEFMDLCPNKSTINFIWPSERRLEEYKYIFFNASCPNHQLFYFRQSNVFTILERINSTKIKISYFFKDAFKQDQKPAAIYYCQGVTGDMMPLDDVSKLGRKSISEDVFNMVYSYVSLSRGNEKCFAETMEIRVVDNYELIRKKIEKVYGIQKDIKEMGLTWQMLFYLSPHEYLIEIKYKDNEFFINFPLIIDTSKGEHNVFLKEIQISGDPHDLSFDPQPEIQLSFQSFGQNIIVWVSDMRKVWVVFQHVYVINKNGWTVEGVKKNVAQNRVIQTINGRYTVQYCNNEAIFNKSVVFEMTDWTARLKDAYIYCLLHLNEDFDDDLLYDCINLLEID